jgi:hypothetical protein
MFIRYKRENKERETSFLISIFCNNCHLRKVNFSFIVGKIMESRNQFKMNFLHSLVDGRSQVFAQFWTWLALSAKMA